jgi:hypothetical protein
MVARIDRVRPDLVPREAYIRSLLETALRTEERKRRAGEQRWSDFYRQWAIDTEHAVHHFVGSRCRDCGHVNEPDPAYVICLPLDTRCEGCGKRLPEPDVFTAPGVDPLAEVNRQFEPIIISETDEQGER